MTVTHTAISTIGFFNKTRTVTSTIFTTSTATTTSTSTVVDATYTATMTAVATYYAQCASDNFVGPYLNDSAGVESWVTGANFPNSTYQFMELDPDATAYDCCSICANSPTTCGGTYFESSPGEWAYCWVSTPETCPAENSDEACKFDKWPRVRALFGSNVCMKASNT